MCMPSSSQWKDEDESRSLKCVESHCMPKKSLIVWCMSRGADAMHCICNASTTHCAHVALLDARTETCFRRKAHCPQLRSRVRVMAADQWMVGWPRKAGHLSLMKLPTLATIDRLATMVGVGCVCVRATVAAAMVATMSTTVMALENGAALTPPLGFSNWNVSTIKDGWCMHAVSTH